MNYCYNYARPALTSDCIVIGVRNDQKYLLLIQRKYEPFEGFWAFPGGFVDENETVENAAIRELEEETGITKIELKQFYTLSNPGRDPRGWTVSVAFLGMVENIDELKLIAGDDASKAQWFPINEIPPLAFDHNEVINKVLTFLDNN